MLLWKWLIKGGKKRRGKRKETTVGLDGKGFETQKVGNAEEGGGESLDRVMEDGREGKACG